MSFVFEKLTPKTDANLEVYKDAFGFVFSNNDIKNIAISGAYGAGKSSILESYKRYENYGFNISIIAQKIRFVNHKNEIFVFMVFFNK